MTDEPAPQTSVASRLGDATRSVTTWLLVIAFGGFLLRLLVISLRPDCAPDTSGVTDCFSGRNDAGFYHLQGNLIADGEWFRIFNPSEVVAQLGTTRPSALHPPLYSYLLGVASFLGLDSTYSHRVLSAALGSTAIVLFGLVAKRLAGSRAAILAALLVALYPAIWINDTLLLSEAVYAPAAGLFLIAAYRFWDARTLRAAVWLGLAVGLTTLARGEALLLLPLTVLPLALGAKELPWVDKAGRVLVAGAACGALLLPWIAFNLSRFEEPVFLTTSAGQGLAAANCDTTYYGALIGQAAINCSALDLPPTLDESEQDVLLQARGTDYMWANKGRVPLVMAARIGRTFHVYAPRQQVDLSWRFDNRGRWASNAALLSYYALLPFGVFGAVVLHRRKLPLSPLLGLVATSIALAAMVYGLTRYRLPADLALAVLAAVGIDALLLRLRRSDDVSPEATP